MPETVSSTPSPEQAPVAAESQSVAEPAPEVLAGDNTAKLREAVDDEKMRKSRIEGLTEDVIKTLTDEEAQREIARSKRPNWKSESFKGNIKSNDSYEILGVDRSATEDEITKAFRAGSKHKDSNPNDPANSGNFKSLERAYREALKNRNSLQQPRNEAPEIVPKPKNVYETLGAIFGKMGEMGSGPKRVEQGQASELKNAWESLNTFKNLTGVAASFPEGYFASFNQRNIVGEINRVNLLVGLADMWREYNKVSKLGPLDFINDRKFENYWPELLVDSYDNVRSEFERVKKMILKNATAK